MSATTPTTVNHGRSESRRTIFESSTNRIAQRPRAASHRIADDRNARSIGPIPDRKEAASEQRRSEGSEETCADLVSCQPQALGDRSVVAFDSEDEFPGVANEQIADDTGALHTGNRLNLFQDTLVKVDPLRRRADRLAKRRSLQGRRSGELHHEDPLRPESRINAVHVPPASDEQAGADEQNDRERKLRHHERAADSTGGRSARDTSATLLPGGTHVAAQRGHRGRQSHQDSRQKRDADGPAQDAEIEAHFIQTRQVARPKGTDEVKAYRGEPCANQSRDGGEQDAFGEQLSHDPSGTRAERRANRHLARAADAARQREARDVGSGDQEDAKHGAAEHPQCQPRLGADQIQTQWDDADASVPFDRRQLIVEAAGDVAHLRLGLLERHGRSKSSNDEPRLSATNALAGTVRLPHVCIEPRDLEIGREDADDLGGKPVEHEGRAERIVRARESRVPEAMADEDQPLPLLGFFGRKATSLRRMDTEEREQVGRNAGADDPFRPFCSRQRPGHGIEGRHVREALTLTPPLVDIPECRSPLAKVLRGILCP